MPDETREDRAPILLGLLAEAIDTVQAFADAHGIANDLEASAASRRSFTDRRGFRLRVEAAAIWASRTRRTSAVSRGT